jgi:hypothetical protein
MDWSNVTTEDLVDSLRQVDWKAKPRPLVEMMRSFTIPRNSRKWSSRVKCNTFYYRANYLGILSVMYLFNFYRNPGSLFALLLVMLSLLLLNDNFAIHLNDKLMRLVRRAAPPVAAKLRAIGRSGGGGALDGVGGVNSPGKTYYKSQVSILGVKRKTAVLFLSLFSLSLVYWTRAISKLLWATFIGFGFCLSHASLRTHNLKARLTSARQDFRAVWRGSSDYTL